jgi:Mn-dependent DtxR family transcriptional regulator
MAQAMFSEKAQAVLTFLQGNDGDFTSKDIAAALDIEPRSITGVLNGLQRKGLLVREVVEGEKDKLIRLTAEGAAVDPNAEKPAKDAE